MVASFNSPDYRGNACAFFSNEDKEKLWQAACTLVDERGLIVRITAFVGQGAEWVGDKASEFGAKIFGKGWEDKIRRYAEDALWRGHDIATLGMDSTGDQEPWVWFNKIYDLCDWRSWRLLRTARYCHRHPGLNSADHALHSRDRPFTRRRHYLGR